MGRAHPSTSHCQVCSLNVLDAFLHTLSYPVLEQQIAILEHQSNSHSGRAYA